MTQAPASGPCAPVTTPPIACWLMRTPSLVCCAPAALGRAKSARVRANATMLPAIADLPGFQLLAAYYEKPRGALSSRRALPCNVLPLRPEGQRGKLTASRERVADAGPVVDRALLTGGDRDHQLAPPGIAQGRDPLPQLLLGRGKGRAADQFGDHEAALLRLHKDKVAAVVEQIARIGRLEAARHLDIARDRLGDPFLRHLHRVVPALLIDIGGAVQEGRGAGPGLRHRARAVGGLARLQHAAAHPGGGVEVAG